MPIFKIEQGPEIAAWLKQGFTAAVKNGSASTALKTLSHIQNELIPAADPQPVDTGAYRAGWRVEPPASPTEIINTLPYAVIIENGARPENIKISRAMIQALKKWVLRKGFFGLKSGGKKQADTDGQAESVAWAIAVSMKKRGIFNNNGQKGLRIAAKAADYARSILSDEVRAEVKKVMR